MKFDAEKYCLLLLFIHNTAKNISPKAKHGAKFGKSRKHLYLLFAIFECYMEKNSLLEGRMKIRLSPNRIFRFF